MSEQIEKKLQEIKNNSSQYIEISDEELVQIIGGAYMQAVDDSKTKVSEVVCTCPKKCCGHDEPSFYDLFSGSTFSY